MSHFDERGRPKQTPQGEGKPTYPGNQGGTNWYSPSYSPRTNLFYISAWEDYASIYSPAPVEYKVGNNFGGGGPRNLSAVPGAPGLGRAPINTWTEAAGHGAVIALDPGSGREKWKFKMTDVTDSGILTTGSDLLFTGGREGYFQALNARTGELLWKTQLGASINSGPITYRVGNKQYVSIVSGLSMFVRRRRAAVVVRDPRQARPSGRAFHWTPGDVGSRRGEVAREKRQQAGGDALACLAA